MAADPGMDLAAKAARLRITPEILALIAEIDEFKGAWQATARLAPERLASLRRVATIESVGSSTRIEGARLTDREVEHLLSRLEARVFTTRDEQEVAGCADVRETVFESSSAIDLSENHIQQLHRDLLAYSDKDERHRGAYKALSNHVEAFGAEGESLGVVFETATPLETPGRMRELVAWTRRAEESHELHPLLVASLFTVTFLAIHPFQDGSGRLSRALTTLMLLRAGYTYVPFSSLESVIEESKETYYLALRKTQVTLETTEPDWEPWTLYFVGALKRQKDRLARKLELEQALLGALPELSVAILELARSRGRVSVAEVVEATGANRNTVKGHLSALVGKGELVRHGAGRGTWYSLS